jgi:hypothetical protein
MASSNPTAHRAVSGQAGFERGVSSRKVWSAASSNALMVSQPAFSKLQKSSDFSDPAMH